ncbi:MAG: hypothetical protein RLZ45_2211 [Verrucomicrobiota bacterium]
MESAIRSHAAYLNRCGVQGIVVPSTTDEFQFFSADERAQLLSRVVEWVAPLPVMANVSDISPRVVARLARVARDSGCASVLLLPPWHFQISQPDLLEFFLHAATAAAPLPIYLGNFPERVRNSILPETVAAFASRSPLAGIILSGGVWDLHATMMTLAREGEFSVLTGWDVRLTEALELGCSGCISGLSNFTAEPLIAAHRAFQSGDRAAAERAMVDLRETTSFLEGMSFPHDIPAGMEARGFVTGEPKQILSANTTMARQAVIARLRNHFQNRGLSHSPDAGRGHHAFPETGVDDPRCYEPWQTAGDLEEEASVWKPRVESDSKTARDAMGRPGSMAPRTTIQAQRTIPLPPVAFLGHLAAAREAFHAGETGTAWRLGCSAIEQRPFHPEGWVFLSEVAVGVGHRSLARRCAQKAMAMTPRWNIARQALDSIGEASDEPTLELANPPFHDGASPRLTVCLITRNEERFIDACLRSVQGLADQIVLVDTGSTDRTVEIARSHGAEVHFRDWDDDFSAARNAALMHARGDWVLILDADEEVSAADHQALRAMLERPNVIAYRLPLVDVGREAEGVSHVPRLFRNAPRQFYVGRIHEQVFSSLEINRQAWAMENLFGDAKLIHHGYQDEVMKSRDKVARNLRLLEQANEEQPNDANLLMNLGLELWRSGQTVQGLAYYQKAYRAMLARSEAETTPEFREVLLTQYASHLSGLKRFYEVAALFTERAMPSSQRTASHWYLLGLAQFALNQWEACTESLGRCLSLRHQASLTPIHSDIHKAMPSLCLAHALQKRGRKTEALKAYEQALQDEPGAELARVDYANLLAEEGEVVPALTILHQGVQQDPLQARVWEAGGRLSLRRRETLEFALDWTDEAIRHLPDEPSLRRQRAETLLLHGKADEALLLWGEPSPQQDAVWASGLILCQLFAGQSLFRLPPEQERAVSEDLIRRYRQGIHLGLTDWVRRLHERVGILHSVLPSAARLLEKVLAESQREP